MCKRCSTTGRKCDGYTSPGEPSPVGKRRRTMLVRQPLPSRAPAQIQASPEELQAFYFFETYAAPIVAGVFDRTFWTVNMMQAAYVHPAVWHGINAVSAMYQRYTLTGASTAALYQLRAQYYKFALAQFNDSIRHLTSIASQTSPSLVEKEVLLVATVLFSGVCSLRGDQQEAFVHMRNGLKLFSQWRMWQYVHNAPSVSHLLPLTSLVTLFNRLGTQVHSLIDNRGKEEVESHGTPQGPGIRPFSSVNEAYFEYEVLMNSVMKYMQNPAYYRLGPEDHDPREAHLAELAAWEDRLNAFRQSPICQPSDNEALIILRLRQLAMQSALMYKILPGPPEDDPVTAQYEEIVSLAEKLQQLYLPSPTGHSSHLFATRPKFSFNPSICEPLHLAATKSRFISTRTRAITFLKGWPRKEGIWDTEMSALFAEAKLDMEKAARVEDPYPGCDCVEDISMCHGHQVYNINLMVLGEGLAKVTMKTLNDMDAGREGVTIDLSW